MEATDTVPAAPAALLSYVRLNNAIDEAVWHYQWCGGDARHPYHR